MASADVENPPDLDPHPFLKEEADEEEGAPLTTDLNSTTAAERHLQSLAQDEILENIFVCAIMGNFLEWYEAALFGVFAAELGAAFFPRLTADGDYLILSFAVFAFAFSVRPIGGFVYSALSRKVGKFTSLRVSMFMMALTTSLTAFIPDYSAIGYWAPVLFISARAVQGMSIGGEMSAMMVYVMDIIPRERRGFFGACLNVSGSGALLSALIGGALRFVFPENVIDAWAWRIPFVGGAVVAVIIMMFINQNLRVSIALVEQSRRDLGARGPAGGGTASPSSFIDTARRVAMITAVFGLSSGGYWFLFVFIPVYLRHHVLDGPAIPIPCLSNSVALVLFLAFSLLGGYFADRKRPERIMTACAIAIGAFAPFAMFVLSSTTNVTQASFLQSMLSSALGLYVGASVRWVVERLPSNSDKYATWGLSANIAAALFGGTMPLCGALLVEHFSKRIGATAAGSLLSILALFAMASVTLSDSCCYSKEEEKRMPGMLNDADILKNY